MCTKREVALLTCTNDRRSRSKYVNTSSNVAKRWQWVLACAENYSNRSCAWCRALRATVCSVLQHKVQRDWSLLDQQLLCIRWFACWKSTILVNSFTIEYLAFYSTTNLIFCWYDHRYASCHKLLMSSSVILSVWAWAYNGKAIAGGIFSQFQVSKVIEESDIKWTQYRNHESSESKQLNPNV